MALKAFVTGGMAFVAVASALTPTDRREAKTMVAITPKTGWWTLRLIPVVTQRDVLRAVDTIVPFVGVGGVE